MSIDYDDLISRIVYAIGKRHGLYMTLMSEKGALREVKVIIQKLVVQELIREVYMKESYKDCTGSLIKAMKGIDNGSSRTER